jgi:hypothetical protein
MPRPGEPVGCPQCATEVFAVIQREGEFELQCLQGHSIRRFFVLVPPDPPPPPVRSPHAAAQVTRPDR